MAKIAQPLLAEPMILTRRHIAQILLRRPFPLFASRSILTSISRPVCVAFPRSGVPCPKAKRLFYTNYNPIPEKFGPIIHPAEYEKLLAHASKCWPSPPSVPPNWSCTWSEWETLISYYWFSPYYLRLPQIELHVNLQYGIRGETRPVLFSNERDAFVFALMNSNEYFLFDGSFNALYRIKGVDNDQQLVELLVQGDDALVTRLKDLEENEEGLSAIQRIMARDETVIPLLVQKFLHYTPVPTTPKMERNALDSCPDRDAEFAQYMSRWHEEVVPRDDDQALDELRRLDEEIRYLGSMIDGSLSENQLREMEEANVTEDTDVAADVQSIRQEIANLAEVIEVATENGIPPEKLEIIRRLKTKIDEIFNEMKDFSGEAHQIEDSSDIPASSGTLGRTIPDRQPCDGIFFGMPPRKKS